MANQIATWCVPCTRRAQPHGMALRLQGDETSGLYPATKLQTPGQQHLQQLPKFNFKFLDSAHSLHSLPSLPRPRNKTGLQSLCHHPRICQQDLATTETSETASFDNAPRAADLQSIQHGGTLHFVWDLCG